MAVRLLHDLPPVTPSLAAAGRAPPCGWASAHGQSWNGCCRPSTRRAPNAHDRLRLRRREPPFAREGARRTFLDRRRRDGSDQSGQRRTFWSSRASARLQAPSNAWHQAPRPCAPRWIAGCRASGSVWGCNCSSTRARRARVGTRCVSRTRPTAAGRAGSSDRLESTARCLRSGDPPERPARCVLRQQLRAPVDEGVVTAWSRHDDDRFPAAVRDGAVLGVQFHPEESSQPGVRMLHAFLREALR